MWSQHPRLNHHKGFCVEYDPGLLVTIRPLALLAFPIIYDPVALDNLTAYFQGLCAEDRGASL